MPVAAKRRLGMPQSSGDAFRLMAKEKIISKKLRDSLVSMTGFRNLAINEYHELDMTVLHHIAERGYKDLIAFVRELGVQISEL